MIKSLFILLQLVPALLSPPADTLRMLFLGDIMQHSTQLQSAYTGNGSPREPEAYNYSQYFKYLQPYFENSHIVAANIETTFAGPPFSGYPLFNSPASLAKECNRTGINLFFAANNHSMDKGVRGLTGSISLFKEIEVDYTGIYLSPEDEQENHPLIVTKRGIRTAFLNYTYGTNGINVPEPYIVKLLDSNTVKSDLQKAAILNPHFTIVSVHWGDEYKLTPSESQLQWEKLFYDYGADIVIGSHPHVPQPVVTYRDNQGTISRVTVYSLGNAISNMTAANTRIGIMLGITVSRNWAGETTIHQPETHLIWTSRPEATGGYFTIIPVKDYLAAPDSFNIKGEYSLIESYYKKFSE